MEEEKSAEGTRIGAFVLGKCVQAVPGVGDIYVAHHVDTGAPALVMLRARGTTWHTQGAWKLELSGGGPQRGVRLRIHEAPATATRADLMILLHLMEELVRGVEHNARVRAHWRARRPRRSLAAWLALAWRTGWLAAAVLLVLVVLMALRHFPRQ
ncbi:hypothetical protein [Archangium primigenium]|uniref:hypothetical protein n=1 Tax=[Archangium] primigenium TaxID=2792470 RepID=UPI00195E0B4D|nr:hypothetical protein [Archangium primigenium]MBM7112840.1 hypothetical protein [Archangium primigenium]